MISGSGHLACRVVDGIVRRLLVLNLGSNLVLVLGLGFRLYSTQEHTRHEIKQGAMHKLQDACVMHLGCTADALRMHYLTT